MTNAVDTYNYESFDFALEPPELKQWLEEGPGVGHQAPDFDLMDLDAKGVRLSELRGRPVVLEFGSYTCPIFSDRVPSMEQLAREHTEATFLVIYVREAHPGEHQLQHRSLGEKRVAAHKLALEEALARRVLVDSLEGQVHRLYGGAWNPVYVIGPDGRVVMRQAWNHPRDVNDVLDALQRGRDIAIAESIDMADEPGRSPIGQRLLDRGGLRALEDFYRTAPPPVREALRNSRSSAVRKALAMPASLA
jgi:peroxiredoxin